jgi:acetyl-CoA carboxylase alpha subunit
MMKIKEIFKDIRADDARANEVIDRLRGLLQKRELMQPVDVNDMVRESRHPRRRGCEHLRAVLHDQDRRHGDGPLDLP